MHGKSTARRALAQSHGLVADGHTYIAGKAVTSNLSLHSDTASQQQMPTLPSAANRCATHNNQATTANA